MAAVALSVLLLVGIERLREGARHGFAETVSGTDLIVGSRTSPVQLLLYAVFHVGAPTNNMGWAAFQAVAADPAVAWAVPVALGDSHRGFPVVGTSPGYFEHFRHGDGRALALAAGRRFDGLFEVVLGAEAAQRLGYAVGRRITLSHGTGEALLPEHADKPFVVTGILARTGTPVDRALHVSLESLEAIHLEWRGGAPVPGLVIPAEFVRKFDLSPKSVTAVLAGLHERTAVFAAQRRINAHAGEPLQAILPGVALDELWQVLGTAERVLVAVSALTAAIAIAGLVAVILAGLGERRRELAVLRATGARPRDIFALLTLEGLFVTVAGSAAGLALLLACALLFGDLLLARYGVALAAQSFAPSELARVGAIIAAGLVASMVPGLRAYRLAVADGLTPGS
ncbi:MAG: ABC transporter permease [Burkholderiales bacterium]|nr:ABC transporter permease [Burkholderiales bacterium]